MLKFTVLLARAFAISGLLGSSALALCPSNSVEVGSLCVDKYEAFVATIPVKTTKPYPCNEDGSDCKDKIFAVSDPGVIPSTQITWYQAQQACANVGKRLLTATEWSMAAEGTVYADNGRTDCNVDSVFRLEKTGSRPGCRSKWGAFDMIGNVYEWTTAPDDDGTFNQASLIDRCINRFTSHRPKCAPEKND
jgi:formylglycine-generating enzyme required for sulfatase activity